jgi:hypothetical protein
MVQNLRSVREVLGNSDSDIHLAKSAKFEIMNFLCGLCVFARDIPTFGSGFAALGPSW